MKINILLVILICILGVTNVLFGQVKGELPPEFNPDTVYVFKSPRPLVSINPTEKEYHTGYGANLIFSSNGFGAGAFYEILLAKDLYLFGSLYISGARNTDEFDTYYRTTDRTTQTYKVANKINRLYMFPLTFGLEKYVLGSILNESFRPFAEVGMGPTFILATPYDREFFSAFGHSTSYTRFGGFLGIGAYFDNKTTTLMALNIRYYFIPFGGNGLESIKNLPMRDFGGLFLSLGIGLRN